MKHPRAKVKIFQLVLHKQSKTKSLWVLLISNTLVARKGIFNLPFWQRSALELEEASIENTGMLHLKRVYKDLDSEGSKYFVSVDNL